MQKRELILLLDKKKFLDLKDTARKHNVKGYSKLKKTELIDFLINTTLLD
jgi:hypothetical protein